ncbi:MAG: hypothetical protein ACREWI_10185 [Telluria sp.]
MKNIHKALLDIVKANIYPNAVRAAAAEGLGFSGGPEVQQALIEIAKANIYPNEVRAAAAKAAGQASID